MNQGDLCPHCLRPECPGELTKCPNRAYVATGLPVAPTPTRPVPCVYCSGVGGLRIACWACGLVGPVR